MHRQARRDPQRTNTLEIADYARRVSPNLRRAVHQAVDLLLDALEQEAEQAKPIKRRGPSQPATIPMPDLPPEKVAELTGVLDRHMTRNGYKKTG